MLSVSHFYINGQGLPVYKDFKKNYIDTSGFFLQYDGINSDY